MKRTADKGTRERARRTFFDTLARGADYRVAAAHAKVSTRSARRWMAEQRQELPIHTPNPSAHERAPLATHPATRFVGRERELREVRELLVRRRVVSVCGPPGVGKSRVLGELCRQAPAGSVLACDLLYATSIDDLWRTLGDAIHPAPLDGVPDAGALAAMLAARGPTLLVLDHFEQVVEDGALLVAEWLALAPMLRVLVGTRGRLRIAGEHVFELEPLGLPAGPPSARAGVSRAPSSARLADSEAGRLLLDRLEEVRPLVGQEDARAEGPLVELVRWLEGIPLAIELAAAQLAHAEPEHLFAVGSPLDLGSSLRDQPGSTLRAAVLRSWRSLTAVEQRVLSRSTVFPGSFDAEAACAVLATDEETRAGRAGDVLPVIAALREKSVLQARADPSLGGRLRFSSYSMIRDFAREHLLPEESVEVTRRMDAHYLGRAPALRRLASGPDAAQALAELGAIVVDLHAAHQRARKDGAGAASAVAESALAAHVLEVARGSSMSALPLLDAAAERADGVLSTAATIEVLLARASARMDRGAVDAAESDVERARALADAVERGDEAGRERPLDAEIDLVAAEVARRRGRLEDAERAARSGLGRVREGALAGYLHEVLGQVLAGRGRHLAAEENYLEARRLLLLAGDVRSEARTTGHLARLRMRLQRGSQDDELDRVLAAARAVGDRRLEAEICSAKGAAAHESGDLTAARAHLARAIVLFTELGIPRSVATNRSVLGELYAEMGDASAALTELRGAAVLARRVGDARALGLALVRLGGLLALEGDVTRARASIDEGTGLLLGSGDAALGLVAAAKQTSIDLAVARQARMDADHGLARKHEGRADAAIVELHELLPRMGRDDRVRVALRMLERRLESRRTGTPNLRIDAEGAWFERIGMGTVHLDRHRVLSRILLALASAHVARTGAEVPVARLLEAGWSDERILPRAARSRVRMAISRLRMLGLRDWVVTTAGGYRLAEVCAVEILTSSTTRCRTPSPSLVPM